MKIHTGDSVLIIAGKDKGKQGPVTRVLAEKHRVIVEGINMRVRHIKKTAQAAGQRISFEASIHVSNVMILDPNTKKPTRIGYAVDAKTGNKKRIAKESGAVIEKAVVKTEKVADAKAPATIAKKKEDKKAETAAAPKKQPFWKRKGDGKSGDSNAGDRGEGGGTSFTTAHRSQGG